MSEKLDKFLKDLKIPGLEDASKKIADPAEEEITKEYAVTNEKLEEVFDEYPDHEKHQISLNDEYSKEWITLLQIHYGLSEREISELIAYPNILYLLSNVEDEDIFFVEYNNEKKVALIRELK